MFLSSACGSSLLVTRNRIVLQPSCCWSFSTPRNSPLLTTDSSWACFKAAHSISKLSMLCSKSCNFSCRHQDHTFGSHAWSLHQKSLAETITAIVQQDAVGDKEQARGVSSLFQKPSASHSMRAVQQEVTSVAPATKKHRLVPASTTEKLQSKVKHK